jgi:hypothetical protein
MLLSDKTVVRWEGKPFVVRVSTDPVRPGPLRANEALLLKSGSEQCAPGFRAFFDLTGATPQSPLCSEHPIIPLPSSLSYIGDGDIVVIRPQTGFLRVLYRKASTHNSLLVKRACNNYCVMCSQPPSNDLDDDSAALVHGRRANAAW